MNGLLWLLASLVPFLLVQRWLHRELQVLFFHLTHSPAVTLGLFSLLFFPGVFLHETSHFFMARLLRVGTRRFSLLPGMLPDGTLRMGYVETEKTDIFRDALIGLAPLVTGGWFVALLGATRLGFAPLAALAVQGQWAAFWQGLSALPSAPDFWLWFYLAFSISSMMMPSNGDRRGWLPILLGVLILTGLAFAAGAGPWMLEHIAPGFNRFLEALALVFGTSLAVHLVLLIPLFILRQVLTRIFRF